MSKTPTHEPTRGSLNSTWLDVTSNALKMNGFRFFAVKNAGMLTSPS